MSEKTSDIKKKFTEATLEMLPDLMAEYASDERQGVKSLIASASKKLEKHKLEMERVENLCYFEKKYSRFTNICGIDEVGRGPLAGPVVAAAVILPKDFRTPYINDSKQLSEAMREELYQVIMDNAVSVGLGLVTHERIDEINILQATFEAMRQAIGHLNVDPDYLLVDAVHIPHVDIPQAGIIKGDAKSISIAAASIIAKVTRDRLMRQYDLVFPEYGFAKNKGYGSAEHIAAIKKYGPSPIHRTTFIGNFI